MTTRTQATRTPGPLTMDYVAVKIGHNICRMLRGPKGEAVAFVNIWTTATEQGEANAEYIKQAWNLHEELVMVLQDILKEDEACGIIDCDQHDYETHFATARALLARCNGDKP